MAELEAGRIIGSYRVVRCIGQGGMGTVYEVEHAELGVHYALKTFTFNLKDEHAEMLKTKFLEEGKVLARLKHPNIAHVFDLAFDEATQMPYFVMDLVTYEDGESYTAADIDHGDIDEEMVYGWFKEVASALDYIHEQGIVHRDIKPSNLLVDKGLHVILTDFGVSHLFGEQLQAAVSAAKTMVTKTGRGKVVVGTEKYMAPEVSEGQEATPTADTYSLAVMLIWWLTGFYYSDNPGALTLLSQKKYNWVPVLARMLTPISRRPSKCTELVKQLEPIANGRAGAPRPPQELAEQKAKKKRSKTRENIIAAVAGLFIVAVVAAGGYFAWQYVEKKGAERDRQVAELKKQMAADKAAAEKKEAEEKAEAERKAAEEKRIADEKEAARKAKIAERERLEAARTKIEKQDPSTLAVRETPKPAEVKPEPEKPKEEFIVVKDEDEYERLPKMAGKYDWLRAHNIQLPQRVKFKLANESEIELIPLKAGAFYMEGSWDMPKAYHKVAITRPFWMSKLCITTRQWRDFDPHGCNACADVEKALMDYPLCFAANRERIDQYCNYLTKRYGHQLPKGYIFRLPTEAEWWCALGADKTASMYAKKGVRNWVEAVTKNGKREDTIKKRKGIVEYSRNFDRYGNFLGKYFIGGLGEEHFSGVKDMIYAWSSPVLDIYPDDTTVFAYSDEETDPLRWVEGVKVGQEDKYRVLMTRAVAGRELDGPNHDRWFHVVVGPDLVAEKNWKTCGKPNQVNKIAKGQMRRTEFSVEKFPTKLSRPKETVLKLPSGTDMVFCGVPKGKFYMSNVDGQEKPHHQVEITRPFWMTKYLITSKQWREYAKYDCEGVYRDLENGFPKLPICYKTNILRWRYFCNFLNEKYGAFLPNGYVFRLPTEAEWEWAFVAREKGEVQQMRTPEYDPRSQENVGRLEKLWKKARLPQGINFENNGMVGDAFIGGRTKCNTFGLFDMSVPNGGDVLVFDSYDNYDTQPCFDIVYEDKETDPVRWVGVESYSKCLIRYAQNRNLIGRDGRSFAHIVIAPAIEEDLCAKLKQPYPAEDFGGVYLGGIAKVRAQSSVHEAWRNSEKRHAALLSVDPIEGVNNQNVTSGFHTKQERFPWVEIELQKKILLKGVRIEVVQSQEYANHLMIWGSDDGKKWRECGKAARLRSHYRFDFRLKNYEIKFLRVGREPNFSNDYFALNKILIYGKEK